MKKTKWINSAILNNRKLYYYLWEFLSPTIPHAIQSVTIHTTDADISRMLYVAPCEGNIIYISPHKKRWHSVNAIDSKDEKRFS